MLTKKRNTDGSGAPLWEIEAKRRLALWRQQLSTAKGLAHGKIAVEVAVKRGVQINMDESAFQQYVESPFLTQIQVEASRKLAEWEHNMACVEQIAYSSLLVIAAQ